VGTGAETRFSLAARIGGRAPASASYLSALSKTFGVEADLAAVRSESRALLEQIDRAHERLVELAAQSGTALAESTAARDKLAQLERDFERTKNRRALVGGVATLVSFTLLGPAGGAAGGFLGAVVGNALGFGTLASVIAADSDLAAARASSEAADQKLAALEAEAQSIQAEQAALEKRRAALVARDEALSNEMPATGSTLRQINTAWREAKAVLDDAKALLDDYSTLVDRASRLGVDVDALKADLEQKVEGAAQALEAIERELHSALFDLCFAVVGAGAGFGLIGKGQIGPLKAALTAARIFDQPPEARPAALAKVLVGTLTQHAGKIALDLAGLLFDAETALDKPDPAEGGPIVQAFLKLGPPERRIAAHLLEALGAS
jgi:predicted  nucleic acid-binding Zn-ribbon protein